MSGTARFALLATAWSCSDAGSNALGIQNGTPALAYPEAVVVTADGFVPCSGVLLAPRVVLSAGHCRGSGSAYVVEDPGVGTSVTASSSWSPYNGNPATSPDVLLVFLDAPIDIASYPIIAAGEIAPGTAAFDIGRTSNGVIGDEVWQSPTVTIEGDAASLGFPFNYRAVPDLSEAGDSGGPIMLAGTHTLVAIVDTDTVEQQISESPPIDLFARLDVVKADIDAQVERSKTFGTVPAIPTGGCSTGGSQSEGWWLVAVLAICGRWARMKKASAAAAIMTCLLGCSGSSPSSDCNSVASVECNKLFQCAQSQAISMYGTESGCEAKVQSNLNCASWMCPSGKSYNGSQVESCISAYNSLSCADINTTPTQCMNINYAALCQ